MAILQSLLLFTLVSGITGAQNITSDTFFYGQSPPVYPSPAGNGTGTWSAAYEKARALVAQMTFDEKINYTNGVSPADAGSGCAGFMPSIPRLGLPGFCYQDSSSGVHDTELVSAYPPGLHTGASWNKNLTYQKGIALGGEFRAKGVNIAGAPVCGPLGRVATGGRNWEGFSNDPYLSGALIGLTVDAMQEVGVIAVVKHFIGNEQESNRNPSAGANGAVIESVSSNIDDKTMHEIYLWPWADAVHEGCGAVMCSYNRLNNSYGCANSKSQNGLLKTELGFQGFVISDWNAQHAGVATANAGLDMTMPTAGYWGPELAAAVNNGSVETSRLDDMVTRIIAAWYQMSQNEDYPDLGVGMPFDIFAPHTPIEARNTSSKQVILDGAIEGHVLVKNVGNALPLKNPKILSLYGYSATVAPGNDPGLAANGGLSLGTNPDPRDYAWTLGFESYVIDEGFRGFLREPYSRNVSHIAPRGTIISGGGGGGANPAYISAPLDALQERAYQDGTALFWDFENINATGLVVGSTDACLVFLNAWASESYDRPGLRDDFSDALVNNIAAQCNNTIVVIHNAGVRLVDQFVENPNVTAIVYAHLPGQDSGRALVSLLYGDVSFSGKLPYTVPKNESDYPEGTFLPSLPEAPYENYPQSNFSEGIYFDYRYFDKYDVEPRYEFGFGLSYTTFAYSSLIITTSTDADLSAYPSGEILQGGQVDLWDVVATVTADVQNSGAMTGAEVAQLYVGIPGGPVKQLRGFEKVPLEPGASSTITFNLTRRDLSTWEVETQKWLLQSGEYQIYVGTSSRDLALNGTLTI